MRKFGKYEKRPEQSVTKKSTESEKQSVLLQTYFTSLMSLVLCVTMFFGTTYAWFTSEVTNTGNEIYIGTLDVELEKQIPDGDDADADPDYVSLSEMDSDGNNKVQLFNKNIRWEPGYTALETIKITNKGDLAFNYVLNFIPAVFSKGEEVLDLATVSTVAQYFDVWFLDHSENTLDSSKLTSYKDINEDNGWEKVGTLDEILDGRAVLIGSIMEEQIKEAEEAKKQAAQASENGESTEETIQTTIPDEVTYTIALHLRQDAENDVMGHKITLNVKLTAYQMADEHDAFGTDTFDKNAQYGDAEVVSTLEGLKKALEAGAENVVLDTDITAGTNAFVVDGGTFDGAGNTITLESSNSNLTGITTTGGTIKNITVDSNGKHVQGIGAGMTYDNALTRDLYIDNVTVYAALYSIVGTAENVNIVVTNSTLYGGISYPGTSHIKVSHTKFESDMTKGPLVTVIEVGGDMSFTNCSFAAGYIFNAYASANDATVTFTNCAVGDHELTAANFHTLLMDDKYDGDGSANSQYMKNCIVIVDGVTVTW